MTARSVYEGVVGSVGATQISTNIMNEAVKQTTINQSGCDVGYNLQNGNNAALVSATKSAAAAQWAARLAAEQAKQASIAVAKNTLTATGDVGPG